MVLGALSKDDVKLAVCLQGVKIVLRELRNIIGMGALVYVAYILFKTVKPPGRARPMHDPCCTRAPQLVARPPCPPAPAAPRHAASSPPPSDRRCALEGPSPPAASRAPAAPPPPDPWVPQPAARPARGRGRGRCCNASAAVGGTWPREAVRSMTDCLVHVYGYGTGTALLQSHRHWEDVSDIVTASMGTVDRSL